VAVLQSLAAAALLHAAPAPITIEVRPATVTVERTPSGQFLNFDLILTNTTADPVTLGAVTMSVLDRSGKLALRREINSDGERPSIDVLGAHELRPGQPELVMNPFERIEPGIDVHRLVFDLRYHFKERIEHGSVTVEVRPDTRAPVLLPVRGRVLVWDGHDFYSHHRRFDVVSAMARQLGFKSNVLRFAYDFFRLDEAGEDHRGDPALNESWFAWGAPVHAVAAGTVVAAVDTWPDARKLDVQRLKTDRMAMFGNHVVVRHADGAFALYAHLRQGSARVKAGEAVQAGQLLGSIGASGGAAVPHLHFQLQTTADADGEGLPSTFARYRRILGAASPRVAAGRIDSGDIIESEQKAP
jgi:Peptidase family M23